MPLERLGALLSDLAGEQTALKSFQGSFVEIRGGRGENSEKRHDEDTPLPVYFDITEQNLLLFKLKHGKNTVIARVHYGTKRAFTRRGGGF